MNLCDYNYFVNMIDALINCHNVIIDFTFIIAVNDNPNDFSIIGSQGRCECCLLRRLQA